MKSSINNDVMARLSPQQREEIIRIRREGEERCGWVVKQIGEIKQRAEAVVGSSARKSQMDREEIIRSVVEGNRDLVEQIGGGVVGQKLEQ
jgi:uracil-DNA glycosylase